MVQGIGIIFPVLAKSGFRFSFMNNIITQQNCELLFYRFLVWEGSGMFGHIIACYCSLLLLKLHVAPKINHKTNGLSLGCHWLAM
jgi:hypothetical protein